MFGGLDVKGSSKKAEDKKPEASPPPAPAATTTSAFSFMQPDKPSAPAPAPAVSAFSFIGGGGSTAEEASNDKEEEKDDTPSLTAEAPMSGFSFLQQPVAATPSGEDSNDKDDVDSKVKDPIESTAGTVDDNKPSSGFSFLSTPATTTEPPPTSSIGETTAEAVSEPVESVTAPGTTSVGGGTSAFSFMASSSGSTAATTTAPPSSIGVDKTSVPPADPPVPTTLPTTSFSTITTNPTTPGLAAGVAIKAATKKPIKKKGRAKKIGVGAAGGSASTAGVAGVPSSNTSLPGPDSMRMDSATSSIGASSITSGDGTPSLSASTFNPPVPTYGSASSAGGTSGGTASAATDAQEAARRAEEFMQEKMREKAAIDPPVATSNPVTTSSSTFTPVTTPNPYSSKQSSSSRPYQNGDDHQPVSPTNDDEYNAAKAAAREAQEHMASSSNSKTKKDRPRVLGFLFNKKDKGGGSSNDSGSGRFGGHHSSFSSTKRSIPSPTNEIQNNHDQNDNTAAAATTTTTGGEEHLENNDYQQPQPQQQSQYQPAEMPKLSTSIQSIPAQVTPPSTMPPQSNGLSPPIQEVKPKFVPPPKPKPKTPNEVLDGILIDFSNQAKQAMDRVTRYRQQRSDLLEQCNTIETSERKLTELIKKAEKDQIDAADAEDYDLADKLDAVIENHKSEKQELSVILDNTKGALAQLDQQRDIVSGSIGVCFAKVGIKLEEFHKDQKNNDKRGTEVAMAKFKTVSQQLSAENERLLIDEKHIARDEELIAKERKEVDDAIHEQTASIEEERSEADEKLKAVQEEIDDIMKKLALKEAVASELRGEISQYDAAIVKVKSNFARQLVRVQKKEEAVKENRNEWLVEKDIYERNKKNHDDEVNAHTEALVSHEELMKRLTDEIEHAGVFEKVVEMAEEVVFESPSAHDDKKKAETTAEDGSESALVQHRMNVIESESKVAESSEILKMAESTLEMLGNEHQALIARLPVLETEKKAAAARRDFKAAGKASRDIKDATARLKECEKELTGEAAECVKAAKAELEKSQEELETAKSALMDQEKEHGLAAMKDLASTIKHLVQTRNKDCNEAKGNSIKGVAGFVLDGQISALIDEGEAYDLKCGGWKAILEETLGEQNLSELNGIASKGQGSDNGDTKRDKEDKDVSKSEAKVAGDTDKTSTDTDGNEEQSGVDKIAKFKELNLRLKEAEQKLEIAVAEEDYDEAAILDEVFQQLQADLEGLGLTDAEMELAASEEENVSKEDGGNIINDGEEPDEGNDENEEKLTNETNSDVHIAEEKETSSREADTEDTEMPPENGVHDGSLSGDKQKIGDEQTSDDKDDADDCKDVSVDNDDTKDGADQIDGDIEEAAQDDDKDVEANGETIKEPAEDPSSIDNNDAEEKQTKEDA